MPSTPSAADFVAAEAVARHSGVSKTWLSRTIERRPRAFLKAVDGVSFSVAKGETLALVGESGCGASTIARPVAGLRRPTSGRVPSDGPDLASLSVAARAGSRRRTQMIFQEPCASLDPRGRVNDIAAEPLRAFELAKGRPELGERARGLLSQVGLAPADGEKCPHEFSGGQRQRISIEHQSACLARPMRRGSVGASMPDGMPGRVSGMPDSARSARRACRHGRHAPCPSRGNGRWSAQSPAWASRAPRRGHGASTGPPPRLPPV